MQEKPIPKNQSPNRKTTNNIVLGVFIFLAFLTGWFLGHTDLSFQKGKILPQIINNSGTKAADFSPFWQAWDTIIKDYDGKLDYNKLIQGAIRGMTNAVGDPYTVYMDPEETATFENDLSGTISGIGAEVGIKNDKLTVIAPLQGSPAEKAGLKGGDLILTIDGQDTSKMSLSEAVSKIRGKEGTKVKLLIQRGEEKRDYEIEREKIEIKSVKHEVKNDNIGYLEISSFDENTDNLLKEAANDLISKNIKGIVLDLRNNPGGLLDSAIMVSSEFINDGAVVIEKKEDGSEREVFKAVGNGKLTDKNLPLVVLVNEGSASASEIVAGAIQDTERGTLIGEKTFGKGSVQQIESLGSAGALRITIAHWYTPNGKTIDKTGLTPNIEVKMSEADLAASKDPQLDKAIEIIKNKIQ